LRTSGCIQVDIGDGRSEGQPHVEHFRAMWTRACAGFIANAADDAVPPPDLELGFAPELLPNEFGYAIKVPNADGAPDELGDRWQQAILLTEAPSAAPDAADGSWAVVAPQGQLPQPPEGKQQLLVVVFDRRPPGIPSFIMHLYLSSWAGLPA
jgi:hypothetical protein